MPLIIPFEGNLYFLISSFDALKALGQDDGGSTYHHRGKFLLINDTDTPLRVGPGQKDPLSPAVHSSSDIPLQRNRHLSVPCKPS